jgi:glycosyltransferase involved in cell wall biosynthesis
VNPLLGRLPDRIFAVSSDLRQHMIAEGLPPSRIDVNYNGIHAGEEATRAHRSEARRSLGIADEEVLLGTVGRLDPVKDLPTQIRAVALLRATGAACRLAIVGDGPEAPRLATLIERLGLAGAVHLIGYRADVRAVMAGFDVYLNSSAHEGVSLTVLEAMATGLPVIATRVGGNPEVVMPGETGLLVPAADPQALADAVASLMRAHLSRRAMGQAGRARVLERFSLDRMVDRYYRSYCEASN